MDERCCSVEIRLNGIGLASTDRRSGANSSSCNACQLTSLTVNSYTNRQIRRLGLIDFIFIRANRRAFGG